MAEPFRALNGFPDAGPNARPPINAAIIDDILTNIKKHPLLSDDNYVAPYVLDHTTIRLLHDAGKRQVPVAADPDALKPAPARILTVHAGCTKRIVSFHKIRVDQPPDVPSPVPATTNEVLQAADLTVNAITLGEDANSIRYEVVGEYVFLLRISDWYKKGVQMPILPSMKITLAEAMFAVEHFKAGQV